MAMFLLELSAAPAALIDIQADLTRLRRTALETADSDRALHVLHAAYIPARETCISLVDGADEDSVCHTLREAGVRARVLPAVALT